MTTDLKRFDNTEFGFIRTLEEDGKIYFVASDIARALGYASPRDAISRHCKGVVKRDILTTGGKQSASMIPEGDMYRLVTHSKLKNAEKFECWVFDEVLPGIRENGLYINTSELSKELQAIFVIDKKQKSMDRKIENVSNDLKDFKENAPLFNVECDELQKALKKKVTSLLGGKNSIAYKNKPIRTKVFIDVQHQIKRQFDVNSYKAIKRRNFTKAIEIIEAYTLPIAIQEAIQEMDV